jgi:hypothetical protein
MKHIQQWSTPECEHSFGVFCVARGADLGCGPEPQSSHSSPIRSNRPFSQVSQRSGRGSLATLTLAGRSGRVPSSFGTISPLAELQGLCASLRLSMWLILSKLQPRLLPSAWGNQCSMVISESLANELPHRKQLGPHISLSLAIVSCRDGALLLPCLPSRTDTGITLPVMDIKIGSCVNSSLEVGMIGFEPTTSASQMQRSDQAELHPGAGDRTRTCNLLVPNQAD